MVRVASNRRRNIDITIKRGKNLREEVARSTIQWGAEHLPTWWTEDSGVLKKCPSTHPSTHNILVLRAPMGMTIHTGSSPDQCAVFLDSKPDGISVSNFEEPLWPSFHKFLGGYGNVKITWEAEIWASKDTKYLTGPAFFFDKNILTKSYVSGMGEVQLWGGKLGMTITNLMLVPLNSRIHIEKGEVLSAYRFIDKVETLSLVEEEVKPPTHKKYKQLLKQSRCPVNHT